MPITRETPVKIVKISWPRTYQKMQLLSLKFGTPRYSRAVDSLLPARVAVLMNTALLFVIQKKSVVIRKYLTVDSVPGEKGITK